MNVLFICSGNKLRSPTAEKVFKTNKVNTRSAGSSANAIHTVEPSDIKWANTIVVMEEKHKQRMLAGFPRATEYKDIIVLNILDNYKYMEKSLVTLLQEKIQFN